MSMQTLRIAQILAFIAFMGCGFGMWISLIFVFVAIVFLVVFIGLSIAIGRRDGSLAKRIAWGDSSRRETWKTRERNDE
jgi:uncharacterized membrane protein